MAKKKKPAKKTKHPQSRGTPKKKPKKPAKPRPLSGRPFVKGFYPAVKKKERYLFKAINRDWLEGVPPHLRATKEARVDFFMRHLKNKLPLRENNAQKVADQAAIAIGIPINMLEPAKNAQREKLINVDQVAQITVNYSAGAYSDVNVSIIIIKNKAGAIIDVRYFVTDGMHRLLAKIEQLYRGAPTKLNQKHNFKRLDCRCVHARNMREVAEAVRIQNAHDTNRRMDKRDNWRIAVEAKQPIAVEIAELVAEYGFDATICLKEYAGWPNFESGQTLVSLCYKFCGEDVVRRVLSLMADSKNAGLHKQNLLLTNNSLFAGLCVFINKLEKRGYAHEIALRELFAQTDLITKVNKRREKVADAEIPYTLHLDKLEDREENRRYYKVAVAFTELYEQIVPQPNTKYGKGSNWENCPSELRQLCYVAPFIRDNRKRAEYIAVRQRRLQKLYKVAPTWAITVAPQTRRAAAKN